MMQRITVGILKLLLGISLGVMAALMPTSSELTEATATYESTVASTAAQIKILRAGVADVKASDYERFAEVTARMTKHASIIAAGSPADAEVIQHLDAALSGVCEALEASLQVAKVEGVQHSRETLLAVADFLDKKVAPAAKEAAAAVRRSSGVLERHGVALAEALRKAPVNADAIVVLGDSLAHFGEAMSHADEFSRELKDKMPAIIDGLRNLKQTAKEVGRYAYYAPGVSAKPFDKAADAVEAAADQLTAMEKKLLPAVTQAMASAAEAIKQVSRQAELFKDRKEDIRRVLEAMPELLASAGRELPLLTKQLADVLEETGNLSDVASGVRKAAVQLESVERGLPAVASSMESTLEVIRAVRRKIEFIAKDPKAYEELNAQTRQLLDSTASALQAVREGVGSRLDEEDRILQAMQTNCESAQGAIPGIRLRLTSMFVGLRVVLVLGALISLLSGIGDIRSRTLLHAAS